MEWGKAKGEEANQEAGRYTGPARDAEGLAVEGGEAPRERQHTTPIGQGLGLTPTPPLTA